MEQRQSRPGAEIAPGYWQNEISGVLRPAVEAYLNGRPMSVRDIAAMRAYLKQWIYAPGFRGPEVEALRSTAAEIRTQQDIRAWISRADEAGIDPL